MNKLKYITPICFVLFLFILSSSTVFAYSFGPPQERTGAPNESTCATAGCHTGNSLNAAGSLVLTVPQTYEPGEVYDIVVKLSRNGQRRWGFQMTALNENNVSAGSFSTIDANTQLNSIDNKYIQHTFTGTAQGTPNMHSWMFKWTAPTADVGPITFYAAGNAANNNGGTGGDYIYTQSATSEVPFNGVSLQGVGNLARQTTDASSGIRYTVQVRNTGNISDTIRLTTSGDVGASLSRNTVILAAGASTNVTVSISGSALRTAGAYEVNVNATSQGDSTKTAAITTTTTILPVYSVSLAGEGDLTKETFDASGGISYTLRITNTGNTDDRIRLTTSGDVNATVTPSSFTLRQGVSRTVTLTILGTVLTLAGDYEVKVKATSQGDTTKTAEIATTTTILPVYDVSIAGVGDLETATDDASDGVMYRVSITNDGNTADVFDLSTSGDAYGTLSADSVSLASGASEEVTLTISADYLTLAGAYSVKVTATSQSDNTKTAEIATTTTITPVYSISLAGVGDLESETSDAGDGVVYTFSITNSGNTADVIDLSTSGDADAALSADSVSLASGASAEVTLSISGDDLMLAGAYEVKVTATSQGDNTETAEITTSTTILSVYDISLAGVGDLETETSDAGAGVVYTLSITNNGNMADVIDLSTSGDAAATLSADSVSLASGASAEVTLSISADGLMLAGDYEVKVAGISQGDDTISSEVSTATTILPVYEVMLEIEGTRTGTTTDAVEGITYRLKITNSGNIEDTILLGSSAEAGIGGAVLGSFSRLGDEGPPTSQLEITLAPGVTEYVMFIASGDLLTQPGGYEIEVTATSMGDSTKSAAITTSTTIAAIPAVYGVTLEGEGELKGSTMDILTGVTYTLIVMNTGNTEDTILLSSSADTAIEGSIMGSFGLSDTQESPASQLEIVVASEASETVLFTVSGDSLTKSGEYEVTVTAASQGDNTQTAELTTTTIVTPVYSVKLEEKDALTGETMDAVKGVSYVLIVTNEGNTEDTVVLSSSAAFGIEGSVLGSFTASSEEEIPMSEIEVVLSPRTSKEVTFTAAGDFFTKPGEYEIVVTATSKADEAQTTELTITTTISPVPWDVNADGTVNILDLVQVTNQFGESGTGLSGDVNMDGQVNVLDLVQVASYIGKTHGEIVQEMQ